MRKKLVLRKWVEVVLGTIFMIALLIAGSECEDTKIFIISHIGAGIVMAIVGYILVKYGRDSD